MLRFDSVSGVEIQINQLEMARLSGNGIVVSIEAGGWAANVSGSYVGAVPFSSIFEEEVAKIRENNLESKPIDVPRC